MAADGVLIAKSSLDQFVCSANSAIELLLARKKEDVDDKSKIFHPEFTHQLFGDSETIFGYKDLRVKLYYSASRLTTYLGMSYTEKVDPSKCDGVQPDEILQKIHEKLSPNYHSNLDDFVASLSKDTGFVPYGELIHAFTVTDSASGDRYFEIYKTDTTTCGFCDYHERLQTFLLWFVDAASYIDIDDNRWHFYLVYEKYNDDEKAYAIAGYSTVYHYYAYPNKVRPRISQMLVLPPFQCKGIGVQLLQSIYAQYTSDNQVLDITVEDASESFTRLRDFVDVKNCLALSTFDADNLKDGLTNDLINDVQKRLKLNKRQLRRVYEIVRLLRTNTNNADDYRSYRLEVKKRLNVPFQKQRIDLERLKRTLRPEELNATLQLAGGIEQMNSERMEQLDRLYDELEAEYRHTLERIAVSKID